MTDDEIRTLQFGLANQMQNLIESLTMYKNDPVNYNKTVDLYNQALADYDALMKSLGFNIKSDYLTYHDGSKSPEPQGKIPDPPPAVNPAAPSYPTSPPSPPPSGGSTGSNCSEYYLDKYLSAPVDFNNCCLYGIIMEKMKRKLFYDTELDILRYFAFIILKLVQNDGKLTEDDDIKALKRLILEEFEVTAKMISKKTRKMKSCQEK